MTNTTPRYTAGQTVDVLRCDFKAPGQPYVWRRGVIAEVGTIGNGRVFDALVRLEDGTITREQFGPRGGGKRLRSAA
jgi:hypothetical protein